MTIDGIAQETVALATEADYIAEREFCEIAIVVNAEGIVISAKKPLRIGLHKSSIVDSYEGLMLSTLRLHSAHLGVVHSLGETPLRERRGFLLDYAENVEEAKTAAVDAAMEWRNELMLQLDKQIDDLKNAPVIIKL